ncbi:MAG: suppressor of fused domain protein [Anaerolineae bacterium]|nr:suppressor of fused domain protein [Anaerolineae bacterium]
MNDEFDRLDWGFDRQPLGEETDAAKDATLAAVEQHLNAYVGPPTLVFHEVASSVVHVDVHVIYPTPERNYYTLVTTGMSDLPMMVPPGLEDVRYAELVMALPPTWELSQGVIEDEEKSWPVRLMRYLARFPHLYETWLGEGHTIPNGDPPEPLAPSTLLAGVLCAPPLLYGPEFPQLVVNAEKTIHFLALVPLYTEEMDFKLANGIDALLERLDAHGVNELLDEQRVNAALE